MKSISFAWTTPALLAGHKTVTRRDWKDTHARRFQEGELVAAYDRQPRFKGKQVAVIRLTREPYKEFTASAPDSDYDAEGFGYLSELGATVDGLPPEKLWRLWRIRPRLLWVVRFQLEEVLP